MHDDDDDDDDDDDANVSQSLSHLRPLALGAYAPST